MFITKRENIAVPRPPKHLIQTQQMILKLVAIPGNQLAWFRHQLIAHVMIFGELSSTICFVRLLLNKAEI